VKILVTGGAGYIGSIVSQLLLDSGHEVIVLDSLERGHRDAVPERAVLEVVDLLDLSGVEAVFRRHSPDAVMHFAAYALVGESVEQPERYWRNNVGGTRNLLDALRTGDTRRLIFSSTCACYGQPEQVPITEEERESPTNPYGQSKLAADRMITDEAAAHRLGAISLRYFNVAGATQNLGEDHEPETHLIPNVLRAAAGRTDAVHIFGTDYPTPDGTAIRDYIHVHDLARAHVLALDGISAGRHRIFNLGNGTGFSVREVVERARAITGQEILVSEAPRRPGDPPRLVAAADRIRAELGWKPEKPELDQMLADAWRWFETHPQGHAG
jgi:UDP-glucose 4-epimerase